MRRPKNLAQRYYRSRRYRDGYYKKKSEIQIQRTLADAERVYGFGISDAQRRQSHHPRHAVLARLGFRRLGFQQHGGCSHKKSKKKITRQWKIYTNNSRSGLQNGKFRLRRDEFFVTRVRLTALYTVLSVVFLCAFSMFCMKSALSRLSESVSETILDPNVRMIVINQAANDNSKSDFSGRHRSF